MRREEFESVMRLLQGVYGENKYPKTRLEVYWEMLQDSSESTFRRFVKKWIANEQYPLMGSDISDYQAAEAKIGHSYNRQQKLILMSKGELCEWCDNGFILAHSLKGGKPYAFLCNHCDYVETHNLKNALKEKHGFDISIWASDLSKKYRVDKLFDRFQQIEKSKVEMGLHEIHP